MKKALLSIFVASVGLITAQNVWASTFTFSNGCTRTCTGDWGSGSSAGNVVCNGTAGPLTCGGALTNSQNFQSQLRIQQTPNYDLLGELTKKDSKKPNADQSIEKEIIPNPYLRK